MDVREIAKAVEVVQRIAKQVDTVTARLDRATHSHFAHVEQGINGPPARYQETVNRAFRNSQTSFERFQQATAALDRHQLNRVSRVLDGWQSQRPIQRTQTTRSPLGLFVAQFKRRCQLDPFELYLRRAHEHPAVARRRGGTRLWFAEWRRAALLAVADGASFLRLRAASRGASPPRRRRASPRPRRGAAIRHRFEQRLRHTIYTHGPTSEPLPNCPIHGGGPPAPIG
jgi:hypothetical protein